MTAEHIKSTKEKVRKTILTLLRNQKEEVRLKKSRGICNRLLKLPDFQAAQVILFYASFDGEVETHEMMKKSLALGKKIALPIIKTKNKQILPAFVHNLQEDLVSGPYGIKEPRYDKSRLLALDDIDLAVVPGVAFDRAFHRLGRGAGYYDRFLVRLSKHVPTFGLAFDFQVMDSLPRQAHDVPLTGLIVG